VPTASAELLLARMRAKVDDLCREREALLRGPVAVLVDGEQTDTLLASILAPRVAQSDLQIFFLLRPASVLGLRPFIESSALGFDGARPHVMLAFGFLECHFRLCDCPLAPFAVLRESSLFLPALVFAPPLLSLELECGLAGCLIVDRPRRLFFSASHEPSLVSGRARHRRGAQEGWHVP
jgi:hypothetical protein